VNYYERHLGDYARDTAHLSIMEHGAYTLLLDRVYATEQGIAKDQVYRLARARSKEEREAVDAVLAEFFVLNDGFWNNGRAVREIERAQAKINAARKNGKTGGRPKGNPDITKEKPSGFPPGSDPETQPKALQSPNTKHQTPDTRHQTPDTNPESLTPASPMPEIRANYPKGTYRESVWLLAERNIRQLLDTGVWPQTLALAASQYLEQQDALGKIGTQFVLSPATFFDPATKHWKGPFPLPTPTARSAGADPEAAKAWDELIASDGAKRDSRTQKAIDAVGGWSVIRERTSFDTPRLRKVLCEAGRGQSAAA